MFLEGKLEALDFITLISFLTYSNKTGILEISINHNEGLIFIYNGEVYNVYYNKRWGKDALFEIVLYEYIDFCFIEGNYKVERKIWDRSEKIILELLKDYDERKALELCSVNV
uniref:DUF4388 domain-containing protein n=1 Tax=Dictyoglomus thermophilum TaxID=14 RepID=A0A7C3MIQ5_DICTH